MQKRPERPSLLLVDDEPENLRALERTLRSDFEVVSCASANDALAALEAGDFAVVVSDQRMPDQNGTAFLTAAAAKRPNVTRVILTGFTEATEIMEAINRAGIYRYLMKPWDNSELLAALKQAAERHFLVREKEDLIRELEASKASLETAVEARTNELKRANEKLSELAQTDPLTKVLNRRGFFQKFHEEVERARRYNRPIAVAMVDVDHFKMFNDMEGHPCGDEALRKIAAIFSSNLRRTDVLARYGGEEFTILMPETLAPGAQEICNRLRSTVETTLFQGKEKNAFLTVSMGIANFPQNGDTPEALIKSADQALYDAKDSGRNRVVVLR